MPNFYIVLGNSNAGKDTFAMFLNAFIVKFSRAYKSMLEKMYNLPSGALDHNEYKHQQMPGANCTYLDELVRAYHNQTDEFLSSKLDTTLGEAMDAYTKGLDVAFTDIRMTEECHSVLATSAVFAIPVYAFVVNRKSAVSLTTDEQLPHIEAMLREWRVPITYIDNNGSIEHLQRQATSHNELFADI